MAKLKYVDHRPIFIPKLTNYRGGLKPSKGQELEVTENEKIKLLKMRNGQKSCWETVRLRRVVEEKDNG